MRRILTESLVSFDEAAKTVPGGGVHYATIYRWAKRGVLVDGTRVFLDHLVIGRNKAVTSREALTRFLERVSPAVSGEVA